MSIRWFASLYSQNYQKWGEISPIHAPRDSTPALDCHADMHALCTYVCVCVPVYMCMHGTMLAGIHDHPCMYFCLSVCLPACLSVSFNPPFCASYVCVCVCMSLCMQAGM